MANQKFYQISSLPSKKSGGFLRGGKGARRRQIVLSVLGVYVIVGGLVGYTLFNTSNDSAKANETAFISTSLRLVEDKEFVVGDKIDLALTLQNTSITESINNLTVDFFSTKDSVSWTSITGGNQSESDTKIEAQKNSFRLPILSSGERVEYNVQGTLQSGSVEYLTILAKVRFLNKEGNQEVNSNRVFTKLKEAGKSSEELISLSPSKEKYAPGEAVNFTLSDSRMANSSQNIRGKLFVSRKDSKDVVTSIDCQFDEAGKCELSTTNLTSGEYSALFMDESETYYSNIANVVVDGGSNDFTPNSQASLEFAFGATSINGIVPVTAKRVLSLNKVPKPTDQCTFEVRAGDKVLTSVKSYIDLNRNCATVLSTSQIPSGDGIYTVGLQGSPLQKDISFLAKPVQLLRLETDNLIAQAGQNINIFSNNILDFQSKPFAYSKATVGIWHASSGQYREVTNSNGELLAVQNGSFQASLTKDLFNRGGLYYLFMKLDDGQQSDFLTINFDDKSVGLAEGGVRIENYDSLRAGQSQVFSVDGVKDRNGNLMSEGNCAADIYFTGGGINAVTVNGLVRNGLCKVVVPAGQISKSGPILVSFTGGGIENKINQSRQFNLSAGQAERFGELNFEYEPVRKGYANNLIVGPVVDRFGNLSSAFNYKLQLYSGVELQSEITDVNIVNGFAKVVLPSSSLTNNNLTVKLLNADSQELLSREVALVETDSKLVLPNFPSELNADRNIELGINGIKADKAEICRLQYIRAEGQSLPTEVEYNKDQGRCTFDWSLNQLRDNAQGLLRFEVGDFKFNSILKNQNGEAASLFALTPELRLTSKNELQIRLLSSVVVDKNGLPVKNGTMRVVFNNKSEEVLIKDGLAELNLEASKLDSKDIRSTETDQRFLDISLEAKAGVLSISRTNDLSIFLGDKEVANETPVFKVKLASTQVGKLSNGHIFEFESDACEAYLLSSRESAKLAKTHAQANSCYVQVEGEVADYTILLTDGGYTLGSFDVQINNLSQQVIWCEEKKNCIIQVQAPTNSAIEAIIYDQDKQFKFTGEELDNVVTIRQNGLNPLRKYLVEVRYLNAEGRQVSFFNEIVGENMMES